MIETAKSNKLDYIDALRGIAILMVLIHHTAQQGNVAMPHVLAVLLSLGTRGVQLFFIASAFTLFRSYNNRAFVEINTKQNFFLRRFFRIAPVYYLGVVYYGLSFLYNFPFWLGMQPKLTSFILFANVFFIHGVSPFWINSLVPGGWSIAVEMVFYLLFPIIFTKVRNLNGAIVFLNCTLIFKIFAQELILYFDFLPKGTVGREFLFYYLPAQLPIFAMGFILYFLVDNFSNFKTISSRHVFLFLFLVPLQVGSTFDFLYVNHIIFGIGFVGLALFMSTEKGHFISVLPLRYIGKISYSMYIIHFIVISWLAYFNLIDFCENYFFNYVLRLGAVVFVSILLSTVTYHWIEIPFQNWAKKIIAKRDLN